jgi:opacity protein-like surface antigen
MNRRLAVAVSIGLALATTACAEMRGWTSKGGDGESAQMSASSPVTIDPAGSATIGTGSVGYSGYDTRVDFSSGIGLDD